MSGWVSSDNYYVSHSSLTLWEEDPEKWVRRYMGGVKDAQTAPMAVGTVFDALVKNKIIPEFDVESAYAGSLTIVDGDEKQKALDGGELTAKAYFGSRNWIELQKYIDKWLDGGGNLDLVADTVNMRPWLPNGECVYFRTKPDLLLSHPDSRGVELDFKLNGFFSKQGVSIANGHVLKSKQNGMFWEFESKGQAATTKSYLGTTISTEAMKDDKWASQLGLYGWGDNLVNDEGEGEWIAWIEQAAWRTDSKGRRCPSFGTFRHKLSPEWMLNVKQRVVDMWTAIKVEMRPLKQMSFAGGLTDENAMMRMILDSTRNGGDIYDTGVDIMDLEGLLS
jgi:hypothetical protein